MKRLQSRESIMLRDSVKIPKRQGKPFGLTNQPNAE